jgi:hypothetical protein
MDITTPLRTTKPWTCDTCHDPIAADAGYIAVMDAATHGHPNEAPSADSPQIHIHAYHRACDPHPDKEPYWFDVARADTIEKWCSWVRQLGTKPWMNAGDLAQMVCFWFDNRDERLPNP